jgi:hypothetical protein
MIEINLQQMGENKQRVCSFMPASQNRDTANAFNAMLLDDKQMKGGISKIKKVILGEKTDWLKESSKESGIEKNAEELEKFYDTTCVVSYAEFNAISNNTNFIKKRLYESKVNRHARVSENIDSSMKTFANRSKLLRRTLLNRNLFYLFFLCLL